MERARQHFDRPRRSRLALGLVSDSAERLAATPSAERIRLDLARFNSRIGELSGGNQQKALVSRAVAAITPIVLLDDPTRGVDIGTKQDFYRLCSELAREGRTLIWHTTEDAELLACDRVLVFANGQIVRELSGAASHRGGDRRGLLLAPCRNRAGAKREERSNESSAAGQACRLRASSRPRFGSGRDDRRQPVRWLPFLASTSCSCRRFPLFW